MDDEENKLDFNNDELKALLEMLYNEKFIYYTKSNSGPWWKKEEEEFDEELWI